MTWLAVVVGAAAAFAYWWWTEHRNVNVAARPRPDWGTCWCEMPRPTPVPVTLLDGTETGVHMCPVCLEEVAIPPVMALDFTPPIRPDHSIITTDRPDGVRVVGKGTPSSPYMLIVPDGRDVWVPPPPCPPGQHETETVTNAGGATLREFCSVCGRRPGDTWDLGPS